MFLRRLATALLLVAGALPAQQSSDTAMGLFPFLVGNMDGLFCQIGTADYCAQSNREKFIILQIESPEALENVEEIAAVEGFDILLFGPGDFSHLIGKPGQVNDPQVVAARKRVAAAAVKHGKFAMMPAMLDTRANLEEEGWRAFTVAADVITLGFGFKEKVEAFNKAETRVSKRLYE